MAPHCCAGGSTGVNGRICMPFKFACRSFPSLAPSKESLSIPISIRPYLYPSLSLSVPISAPCSVSYHPHRFMSTPTLAFVSTLPTSIPITSCTLTLFQVHPWTRSHQASLPSLVTLSLSPSSRSIHGEDLPPPLLMDGCRVAFRAEACPDADVLAALAPPVSGTRTRPCNKLGSTQGLWLVSVFAALCRRGWSTGGVKQGGPWQHVMRQSN